MCLNMTVIAYGSEARMVSQCEHGTIHLIWEISTLRLSEQDFLFVAEFLERNGSLKNGSVHEGWCMLECDPRQNRRLWIGQVGLVLDAVDFAELLALVKEAAAMAQVDFLAPQSLLEYPNLKVNPSALGHN
jgi:hypothetical protein